MYNKNALFQCAHCLFRMCIQSMRSGLIIESWCHRIFVEVRFFACLSGMFFSGRFFSLDCMPVCCMHGSNFHRSFDLINVLTTSNDTMAFVFAYFFLDSQNFVFWSFHYFANINFKSIRTAFDIFCQPYSLLDLNCALTVFISCCMACTYIVVYATHIWNRILSCECWFALDLDLDGWHSKNVMDCNAVTENHKNHS